MFKDIFTSIINKADINLFATGTVYTVEPLTVKLIPDDAAIQVKHLMSVKDLIVGSRLLLLRFGRQFIAIGAIGESGSVAKYPNYFNFLEWLDYCYYYNQKRVENCQSGWGKNGGYTGTYSNDTVETFLGAQAARMTVDHNGEAWILGEKNITCNMKTSEIGHPFDNDDYVVYCFKVSNNDMINIVQLMIVGASGTKSAWYNKTSGFTTDQNGWNTLKLKFSEFTNYDTMDWEHVNMVSFRLNHKAGYVGQYITCQYIGVVRKHPTEVGKHSLFQYYKEKAATYHQIEGVNEFDNLSVLDFDSAGSPSLLKPKLTFLTKKEQFNYMTFSEHYNYFSGKVYLHVKNPNSVGGLVWWIDSDNYIACHIGGDVLYMNVKCAGVETNGTQYRSRAVARNDLVVIYLIKQNGFIKCSSSSGIILLDDPFASTDYGNIMLSHPLTNFDMTVINLNIDTKTTMYQEEDYYEV